MKSRIIFFIAALAVFSSPANAQLFNTVRFYNPSCTTINSASIVRVAPSNIEVVAYHSHGDVNEFYLIDDINNNIVSRFKIPDRIHVFDFQIVDDMVFFCGRTMSFAVVGHFPIQIFHNPALQFKYYTSNDLTYFKKMVAYPDPEPSFIQLEVIGDDSISPNTKNNVFSEFIYDPATDNIISSNYYSSGNVPLQQSFENYYQDGIFQDITVTKDYLVLSGWDYSYNNIYITRFPKYAVLTGSVFKFDESGDPYTSSRIYMESLLNNDIVTAATYIDPNNLPVGIRLRTIDVSLMTNTITQFVPLLEKTEPEDMLFMKEDQSLLLLQKSFYPTISDYQSVIYYLDPYNNSYVTDVLYNFDCSYYSLDRFTEPIYIAAGLTNDYYHGYLMRYKPTYDMSCIDMGDIRIDPKNNSASSFFNPIYLNPLYIIQYTPPIYPDSEPIKVICPE